MISNFDKPYNPREVEDRIYKKWENSGYFAPEARSKGASASGGHQLRAGNPKSKKTFSIAVPPPNVTGSLHMGHALNAVIQDILIRKKRMEGYKTLWIPGTDHAGIATQNAVEKDLRKQGISRHELGREKFLEKIWEWKEKYGNIILDQFKKLGSSMDWSRTRFTMDFTYQKAVEEAFLHYYKKGWIYRAERVINWCWRCATSLSDLELEYKEENTFLYYINYPIKEASGFITVATTRPETMLGDAAIAVNPKDDRYKHLIGKTAILPIQNREIPIIVDRLIDMNFGTGAVKITPAHDLFDAEISERHKLKIYKVVGPDGKMAKEAGLICENLKIAECRNKIIEELKQRNILKKEEPYKHNAAHCYRCGVKIEPIPSLQWFLKMDELAKIAVKAVKSGKIKFHPKRWEKIYFDWLKNIKDWCISRQIWWGHKIPIEGVDDVLDTWFSSALWPFATLGWPGACERNQKSIRRLADKNQKCQPIKNSDLANFYPTQILSTARDIINLWVTRMIFSGFEFMGEKPFGDVIIHPTILTKDGKRMSKSLGTGIDPIELVEKYGADATRFGIIWQMMGNQDIHWDETSAIAGKKFANKLWNITRFILTKTGNSNFQITNPKQISNSNLSKEDKKILKKMEQAKKSVEKDIDAYDFGQALHTLYNFIWRDFADKYIEYSKNQESQETLSTLNFSLLTILKLLHPFMPFITEEIWQNLPDKENKMLIIEKW